MRTKQNFILSLITFNFLYFKLIKNAKSDKNKILFSLKPDGVFKICCKGNRIDERIKP